MIPDHLTTLSVYLKDSKALPLEEALKAAHGLLGEALDAYSSQPVKPPTLWLKSPVVYNWTDEKYLNRLNGLFMAHDVGSSAFPWWIVIQITLQLIRFLLSRA